MNWSPWHHVFLVVLILFAGGPTIEWLLEYLNPSKNCTSFCCSEVQNISGRRRLQRAAADLWAWALASVMVPCLRHYLVSIISLLLCVVIASGTVRSKLQSLTNSSATSSHRSVKSSGLFNLTLRITSTVGFSWSVLCVSRYWIGFRSGWSLVPFDEFVFAMAEALTFLTFSSKLWLDKQQADLSFRTPQLHEACCWLTNFLIFAAFEGYAFIAELFKISPAQHPGELSTIYLAFPTLLASFYLAVLAVFGKTSWLRLSAAVAEDSSLTEPLSCMRISTTAHTKLMKMNGVKEEEEEAEEQSVTRFWKASLLTPSCGWVLSCRQVVEGLSCLKMSPVSVVKILHKLCMKGFNLTAK